MLFSILRSGLGFGNTVMIILAFAITIMIALVVHECAHGWMAYKQGDGTAKAMGRLTLNPAKHIDPLGLVCFILAGIGWAKPVPVNPFNYRNFRRGNFWVSIAGVLSNFLLGFLFSFVYFLTAKFGDPNNLIIVFFSYMGMFGLTINASLIVFNLLPIYPLDGYNILVSFTKPYNRFMRFMREYGTLLLLIFVVFGGSLIGPLRQGLVSIFMNFWGLFF